MKKNFLYLIFLVVTLLLFSNCGVSEGEHNELKNELNRLKADNVNLRNANNKLKKELESIKYGAERLFNNARNYVKSQKYDKARVDLKELIKRHPASNEAAKAKQMLANVENTIKRLEKEKKLAEQRRLANATKKLRRSYDKIEKIYWYHDRYSQGTYGNRIFCYIGKNNSVWLRFKIRYYGDNWLFVNHYTIQIDGKNQTFYPKEAPKRDVGSGSIWETIAKPAPLP